MAKARLPATLDRLRAVLDEAAVHRVFLPLGAPAYHPSEIADALHVSPGSVALPLLVDVDGDRLLAILPGNGRLDLPLLAATVGARHARLAGHGAPRGVEPVPLPAVIIGLPTVIDRSLMAHQYIFGSTDDPSWVVRIEAAALQRVTGAIVSHIVRTAPPSSHAQEQRPPVDEAE